MADDAPRRAPARTYTLLHEIGRGGIGGVVAARDHRLDRTVAIEELHGTMSPTTSPSRSTTTTPTKRWVGAGKESGDSLAA